MNTPSSETMRNARPLEHKDGGRPGNAHSSLDLSVVIVTRNEETVIARCVESVLRETEGMSAEVILVDSASTDSTLHVVAKFPITVLQITEPSLVSPSAGRFVGTRESRGRIVLFLDGDMVLAPGWIKAALCALQDPSTGGVGGWLYRVFPGEQLSFDHPVRRKSPGEVRSLGGAGAYRRDVLDASGTFHPFMRGEEEKELCYRIRQQGYRILKVDAPMAYHFEKPKTAAEIREKAAYYVGMGQVLRTYPFSSLTRDLIWSQRSIFDIALVFLALLVCLLLALAGVLIPLMAFLAFLGALGVVAIVRKGMQGTLLLLQRRALPYPSLARGIRRGLNNPLSFPATAVRWVRPKAGGERPAPAESVTGKDQPPESPARFAPGGSHR